VDLDAVESYIRDDVYRLGSKLDVIHERMRGHLADLLVSLLPPRTVASRTCLKILSSSAPPSKTPTAMALPSSTMVQSNLSAAISPRTLATTSSGSKNSGWTKNSASIHSLSHYISFKSAFVTQRNPKPMLQRMQMGINPHRHSSHSLRSYFNPRLGLSKTSFRPSCRQVWGLMSRVR